MTPDKLKRLLRAYRKQVRLTKKFIKLAEKRKAIISRVIDEKNELLECLKVIDEYLGELPDREIDKLMDSNHFKSRVMRVLKKYLGEGDVSETVEKEKAA
jgi:NADH:ubiquinone oxidoreductase subunit E